MKSNLQVVLTKINSNHNNLSRNHYTGWLYARPSIGEQVHMETREEGTLWTTPIKHLRFISDSEVEFDTRNSTYKLQYVKEDPIGDEFYITELERDMLEVFVKHHINSNLAVISALKDLEKKLCGGNNAISS